MANIPSCLSIMRSGSISPEWRDSYSADVLHEKVRNYLMHIYQLNHYDIFLMPSRSEALGILSRLLYQYPVCHFPAPEGSSVSSSYRPTESWQPRTQYNSGIKVIFHVSPDSGEQRDLTSGYDMSVVDATDSFATLLHRQLINSRRLFLASLSQHAAISDAPFLVAVPYGRFSCLFRSQLRLFEKNALANESWQQLWEGLNDPNWKPYNIASVLSIDVTSPNGLSLVSISSPGLPFSCIPIDSLSLRQQQLLSLINASYQPQRQILRLGHNVRGSSLRRVDCTSRVMNQLKQLWSE